MIDQIRQIAESIEFEDCAHCVHASLMRKLADNGFGCEREVDAFYPWREGTRRGRIDILAYKDGKRIGIEIDNCTPRPRSLLKLLGMDLDYRIMVLRRKTREVMPIRGIDGVFYIRQPRGGRGTGL